MLRDPSPVSVPIRVLIVERSPGEARLVDDALQRAGLTVTSNVVSTRAAYLDALGAGGFSAVISFDGIEALQLLRERDEDLPFFFVCDAADEDRAVAAMRLGANDYILTDHLPRLAPALEREVRDVADRIERRRLTAALQRAEQRYRRTFEQAPIAVASSGVDGRIIEVNQHFVQLFGRPADEYIGMHFTELLRSEDVAAGLRSFREFLRQPAGTVSYERQYRHRDGSTAWANVTLASVGDGEGVIDYVIALIEDITARKQAEESLRAHTELLAEAEEIANIGSWQQDLVTGQATWSDHLWRMYGFEPGAEPNAETVFSLMHPEDAVRLRELERTTAGTGRPFTTEFRVLLPDGMRTMNTRGRAVLDARGRPVRIVGIVQDVTERVKREEELRRIAVQQSAVANLGQTALGGKPIEFLLRQVSAYLVTVLDVDLSEILQKTNGLLTLVAGEGWDEGAIGSTKEFGGRSQAAFTIEHGHTVVVPDLREETRFVPSELVLRQGAVSGLTVVIYGGEERPWGVLGVYSRSRREFSTSDADFLRSVAIVVGQAIERARVDAELRTRAAQQSAIAELGRAALAAFDASTFERACDLVRRGLGADEAAYVELLPDGNGGRFRSGTWPSTLTPPAFDIKSTQFGATVRSGAPVVVADYGRETRFETVAAATAYGLVSCASVPVMSARRTHGVLFAATRTQRDFGPADIDFLQALGNILAEAIERHAAQAELADSEERYRSVVEGASEIIFTVDSKTNIVTLNAAFETITGWKRQQWIGRPFTELLEPEEGPRLRRIVHEMAATLQPMSAEAAIAAKRKNVLVALSLFPEVRGGGMTGVYGFARDITEARRTELERAEVTRSLRLVLESTAEGIYTVDEQGRCTMINPSAARMLGRAPAEFIGSNMHAAIHAPARGGHAEAAACPILTVFHDRTPRTVADDVFLRSDGTALHVDYSAAPIVDRGNVVGVVVTFSDVSERRKLEQQLEQANRLSSLGRLAATIAHEFNNVLMAISPFLEVLRRRPEKSADAIDQIARAVGRGRGITHDILRYTRPAEPNRAVFAVEPWLYALETEARSVLPRRCAIEFDAGDEELLLDADAHQLHQIFMNMILNARDAMPDGGTISVAVRREPPTARFPFGAVEQPERFAHFTVADNGSGMPPEVLKQIFEPLFTTKNTGTGLGLAVSHQVVHRHGGELFAESEPGRGTTFHVFLPLGTRAAVAEAPSIEPAGEMASLRTVPARRPEVLLVEDETPVAAGIVAMLEMEGIRADVAATGAAALAYLESKRPDVVILDVGLPDMDGTAVFQQIALRYSDLPVIFSTGHADRATLDRLSDHPTLYLLKPFESDALIEAIAKALR